MDQIMNYVKPELIVVAIVLYFVGMGNCYGSIYGTCTGDSCCRIEYICESGY